MTMERFIARENIRRFKAQLADCSDQERLATLQKLLADEEDHLARRLESYIPVVS